ncbi:MAG: hypothetical protein EP329_26920 [Deltaproteobacteria bacterium]|nr:MAG: hypothetical protein EP329_26920 [Deltaproteobacteria bacterium]
MSGNLEILTMADLASSLGVPVSVVARLVETTNLPRFTVGGEPRFLAGRVLDWLEAREGQELLPPEPAPAVAPRPVAEVTLEPAGDGEHPFVTAAALDALGAGAADPGRNLDRLTLRDTLLELNEALLPILGRLSHSQLHPHHDEKSRTSPWRLDDAPGGRIDALTIAWGAGASPPAGFTDRPRLEVELSAGELRVALVTTGAFAPPLGDDDLERLQDHGISLDEDAATPVLAKVYPIGQPAPTLVAIARALESDLRVLVPIWSRAG